MHVSAPSQEEGRGEGNNIKNHAHEQYIVADTNTKFSLQKIKFAIHTNNK